MSLLLADEKYLSSACTRRTPKYSTAQHRRCLDKPTVMDNADLLSSTSTPTPSLSSSSSCPSHSTHSTPTRTKPKAALRKYLKGFFTERHHNSWSYTNFDGHCRLFPDSSYAWSNDKIYSFYLDELRRIRNDKSTRVPDLEITKLLNRAKSQYGRSQKKEKSRSKKAQEGVGGADPVS